ncbi:hypothetical protein HX025_15715 [Myroides odoratimimus]|uniref:hypothetical protein n=1 Tax=Myroides odoratimimus TaxID=76832 RepID=UPI002576EB3D|nr:hypothetical protein [Myroides odoratimimus]MDM1458081.1 hypothetical protein [Myroides odoratimimus]
MKKLFFVAIAFATFSGSALALDVNTLFTIKSSTHLSLDQDPNAGLVYAYLVRLADGWEVYVQGYECAVEFAQQRGGTIVGGKYMKGHQAMMCLTGPEEL